MFDNLAITKERCCVPQETEITGVRLAAAYVPFQKLCSTFCPLNALIHGTVFPPLVSDYEPRDRRTTINED